MIIGLTISLAGTEINTLFATVLLTTVILFPTVEIKRKLLSMIGIEMPSKREIQALEKKYGMPPKTIGKKNNGHPEEEEKEYEEIAV